MDEQNDNLSDLADPAQRAGSIVTEHVNSVIDAAERQAHEVLRDAERDAEATRREALESAQRVFERIDQLERPLREFVQNLRLETDRVERELAGHVDAEATTIPSESQSAKAALSLGGVKAVDEPVETTGERVGKVTDEQVADAVEDPGAEPVEEPVEKAVAEQVNKLEEKPLDEPGDRLEEKPLDEPVERPIDEPIAKKPVAKKPLAKGPAGSKAAADRPGGKRPSGKRPSGKKSGQSKPVDRTVNGPARQAAEGPLATTSKLGWKRRGRDEPAAKPEAKRSTDAKRVTPNGDKTAPERPATSSPSSVLGSNSAEPREPRPATVSPTAESGPAKLASRLLGRLRNGGATKSAFITTEGHCSVCQKPFMAGSEEELEQSGWKVTGDVGLCPECQSDAWQLPEGARLPFRRGGG